MNPFVLTAAFTSTVILAATTLDGSTSVPLGAVLGSAATVFLVGMWVSRKVTRFEEVTQRFSEQQAINVARLDALVRRILEIDEKLWSMGHNRKST